MPDPIDDSSIYNQVEHEPRSTEYFTLDDASPPNITPKYTSLLYYANENTGTWVNSQTSNGPLVEHLKIPLGNDLLAIYVKEPPYPVFQILRKTNGSGGTLYDPVYMGSAQTLDEASEVLGIFPGTTKKQIPKNLSKPKYVKVSEDTLRKAVKEDPSLLPGFLDDYRAYISQTLAAREEFHEAIIASYDLALETVQDKRIEWLEKGPEVSIVEELLTSLLIISSAKALGRAVLATLKKAVKPTGAQAMKTTLLNLEMTTWRVKPKSRRRSISSPLDAMRAERARAGVDNVTYKKALEKRHTEIVEEFSSTYGKIYQEKMAEDIAVIGASKAASRLQVPQPTASTDESNASDASSRQSEGVSDKPHDGQNDKSQKDGIDKRTVGFLEKLRHELSIKKHQLRTQDREHRDLANSFLNTRIELSISGNEDLIDKWFSYLRELRKKIDVDFHELHDPPTFVSTFSKEFEKIIWSNFFVLREISAITVRVDMVLEEIPARYIISPLNTDILNYLSLLYGTISKEEELYKEMVKYKTDPKGAKNFLVPATIKGYAEN